jgi:hypothetical protein
VLQWPAGAEGRGALLVGNQPFIVQGEFHYSYPNLIPLDPDAIRKIVDRLLPRHFARLYGRFPRTVVDKRS